MKIHYQVKGGLHLSAPGGRLELDKETAWDVHKLMKLLAMNSEEVGLIILNGKLAGPEAFFPTAIRSNFSL